MEVHYFVPYEQSLELHNLGFKTKTLFGVYSHGSYFLKDGQLSRPKDGRKLLDMIAAPTWEQVFEWLLSSSCLKGQFLSPQYEDSFEMKLSYVKFAIKKLVYQIKKEENEIRNTN